MNYNPYAAPQTPGSGSPNGPIAAGPPQPWEIGEVFSRAWEMFKPNWVVLVLTVFIVGMLSTIPNMAITMVGLVARGGKQVVMFSPEYWTQTGFGGGSTLLVTYLFWPGTVRIFIAVARGQQAQLGMLFSAFRRTPAVLATGLLQTILVVVGLAFLVIPGIYLGCALFASTTYAAEAELGPIESLKASFKATEGQRGRIFLFLIVTQLINLGGFMACCVGTFVAGPVVYLAMVIVYLRISGRDVPRQAPPPPYAGPVYGTGYNG